MNFSLLKDVEPEEPEDYHDQEAADAPRQPTDESTESHEDHSDHADPSAEETEFVAEEKKPTNQSALMLFAILIIGGAGIYVMYLRTSLRSANASPARVADAEATISDFMQGGTGSVSLLRKLLDGTANIVQQFKSPQVAQVPLDDLKSNPFHMATAKAPTGADAEELARKKKEEQRIAVLKAVQSLRLQTVVVHSDHKACMINNTLYQEGDTVDGFVLEHINSNSVIVKNGAFRFELRMTN
jgi:hypothetical protein